MGLESVTAERREIIQTDVTRNAERRAASVGGVSLDEEMANLMSAQRAYELNSKTITIADEMLQTANQIIR